MTLAFDTSSLSRIINGDLKLAEIASDSKYEQYILPLAVDAELRYGFKNGNRESANLEKYEGLKNLYGVTVIVPDQDTSIIYANLAVWCRKNGLSLSNNDLWVAATSMQNGAQLLTVDQDFERLPQLSLVLDSN